MVITSDFNIFADKYHNRQHLPDDLIKMIMNINTQEIKIKKNYKNVLDTINQIKYYDDDGDTSINDLTSNDEAWRHIDSDFEYIFIEPLYPRIFGVLREINLENGAYYERNKHKKHKISKDAWHRSISFYQYFWTLYNEVENTYRNDRFFQEYKKLYPENLVRDWD